jgi:hypothetical protein
MRGTYDLKIDKMRKKGPGRSFELYHKQNKGDRLIFRAQLCRIYRVLRDDFAHVAFSVGGPSDAEGLRLGALRRAATGLYYARAPDNSTQRVNEAKKEFSPEGRESGITFPVWRERKPARNP